MQIFMISSELPRSVSYARQDNVLWRSGCKAEDGGAGVVALWDVGTGQQLSEYEAHQKRIWAVDFCHSDPLHFVSGSDDGWVRVWSTSEQDALAQIDMKANVCCVKYNAAVPQQVHRAPAPFSTCGFSPVQWQAACTTQSWQAIGSCHMLLSHGRSRQVNWTVHAKMIKGEACHIEQIGAWLKLSVGWVQIAVGCADHCLHLYDLRKTDRAVSVMAGAIPTYSQADVTKAHGVYHNM